MTESSSKTSGDDSWYQDGLNFTCTECGKCCTGAPGVVWVTEPELQDIAEHLGKSIGEIRLFHTRIVRGRLSLTEYQNGDCTFYDAETRHCKVYPVRPIQCQTWPFWTSNLSSQEKWDEVCEDCPGAGQGAFFSIEEIEARAGRMDV